MDRLGWWIFAASYLVICLEDTGIGICNYNLWQWLLLPVALLAGFTKCFYLFEFNWCCVHISDIFISVQYTAVLLLLKPGGHCSSSAKKNTLRSFPSFEDLSIAAKRSVGTEVAIESQGAQYDLRRWRKQKQNAERGNPHGNVRVHPRRFTAKAPEQLPGTEKESLPTIHLYWLHSTLVGNPPKCHLQPGSKGLC